MSGEPDINRMAVEKMEGGLIQFRKGFSALRAENVEQMEALDFMNTELYKIDQKMSDVRKVFYGD